MKPVPFDVDAAGGRVAAWFWCARAAYTAQKAGNHSEESFFRYLCAAIVARHPEVLDSDLFYPESPKCAGCS